MNIGIQKWSFENSESNCNNSMNELDDFLDNKITSFYVKWSDLKAKITNCIKKHEKGIKNYKKFIKYLSDKFQKPMLFPDITEERLMSQWERLFKEVTTLWQQMKLKELIENDDKYAKFNRRISFYETSWDIAKSIGNYLNSPDIKAKMDEAGPYVFKDLSSQDQLVLMKLQYEGRIAEMQEIIERQRDELDRYRNNPDQTSKVDVRSMSDFDNL